MEGRREQPSNTAEFSLVDVAISAITVPSSLFLPSIVAVAAACWHSSHSNLSDARPEGVSGSCVFILLPLFSLDSFNQLPSKVNLEFGGF